MTPVVSARDGNPVACLLVVDCAHESALTPAVQKFVTGKRAAYEKVKPTRASVTRESGAGEAFRNNVTNREMHAIVLVRAQSALCDICNARGTGGVKVSEQSS